MSGDEPRRSFAGGKTRTWVVRNGSGFWRHAPAPGPCPLTRRQEEVLDLMLTGLSDKEIARRLGISDQTVKNHVHLIKARLGVVSRVQAAVWWAKHGDEVRHPEREGREP